MLERVDHSSGGYAYLTGGEFASGGVVALDGMGIRHVILTQPIQLSAGLDLVRRELDLAGRPSVALCGLELRLASSMSMAQFDQFNGRYLERLGEWGLLRDGGSPLARTNVAPASAPPETTSLVGFSFTEPALTGEPDLVLSGAADLDADGVSVRAGETSVEAMVAKASFVANEVNARMIALGTTWSPSDRTHLYCARPAVFDIARQALGSSSYGWVWHDSVPPVMGLELEIDVRRHHQERLVGVG